MNDICPYFFYMFLLLEEDLKGRAKLIYLFLKYYTYIFTFSIIYIIY